MPGVGVLFLVAVAGITQTWAQQYLNHRPFPTYSLENMPETQFSCRDKILGGYYADPDTQCQMFHICVKVSGVGVQDFRFLCPNGTAFDQDHQICAEWEDVDCDASTLYYSSDNFDLYRIGSGLESKSVKYGEDEETFALQRAETGDSRLNREHQSGSVNQKKEKTFNYQQRSKPTYSNNNNNNNDKEIFKASSSSNFFNNRNNGKERDEDYDDNVNVNQDRDYDRRKVVRNKIRRPVQNNQNNDYNNNRNNQNKNAQPNDYNNQNRNNNDYNRNTQNYDHSRYNQNQNTDYNRQPQNTQSTTVHSDYVEPQTRRPASRPTGFLNNFAGSSYVPTTSRPSASSTINSDQYTTAVNNYRARNGQKQRQQPEYTQTPQYTVSTPAPFKQTQYRQSSTYAPTKDGDNYPKVKVSTTERYEPSKYKPSTDHVYEVTKNKLTTSSKTENYPSNNPQYANFDKKTTTPFKQPDNYQTTLSSKPKPFSQQQSFPTTFAPRTNAAYTQIAQQTLKQSSTLGFVQTNSASNPSRLPASVASSTPYTPTVPKISPTTPIARSSRFDETQYDDGSYDSSKYEYEGDRRDDEFLKGAHSQNIAASRNEYAKTTKYQQSTQKYHSTQKPAYDSPRPFSVNSNTQKTTSATAPVEASNKPNLANKKTKDVSYDYAYYDTANTGSEPEYEIDTELKKSSVKN